MGSWWQLLGGVSIFLGASSTTQDTGRSVWDGSVRAGGMLCPSLPRARRPCSLMEAVPELCFRSRGCEGLVWQHHCPPSCAWRSLLLRAGGELCSGVV